tara:strand:- start:1076 stop:1306 length:231 start_codon:yes stop_codon:yes gene_type:complete
VQKYKNYSHLQAFYSPYPLPPGGAGVTSGKNQLTSGSGVSIHQETSQLVQKYKNYSHFGKLTAQKPGVNEQQTQSY